MPFANKRFITCATLDQALKIWTFDYTALVPAMPVLEFQILTGFTLGAIQMELYQEKNLIFVLSTSDNFF